MARLSRALLALSLLASSALGYTPTTPTNDTSGVPEPENADSTVLLRWTGQGNYQEGVTRLLTNDQGSSGIAKGALVHFWENSTLHAWDEWTTTPWIALVNCDRNSSAFSMYDDIFTLARDRGAVASLLYSTSSETCTLNADYLDPDQFDRVLDVYTTLKRSSARLIESQFQMVNKTEYYFFNAARLNNSFEAVNNGISGQGVEDGYLIATLKWTNVTDPHPGVGSQASDGDSDDGDDRDTGLAMIILYVITGCVSVLFCIVIISGAIRAFRHPERYGPRMGDPTMDGPEGAPQTRAAGLTRAILDTFPVVKFGGRPSSSASPQSHTPAKDTESQSAIDMPTKWREIQTTQAGQTDEIELIPTQHGIDRKSVLDSSTSSRPTSSPASRPSSSAQGTGHISPSGSPAVLHQKPASLTEIGTDNCPICIVDFQDGDDLRILPCGGQHKFHKDCVDPWLLELSSSCPVCRQDFHALENMANGVSPEDAHQNTLGQPPPPNAIPRTQSIQSGTRSWRRRHSTPTGPDPPTGH